MFRFFESLIKPFPAQDPQEPPKTLYAFCRHYTRGTEFYLIAMAVFTGIIAILEVSLFGYLGNLVDLLNTQTPDTFWSQSGDQLLLMAFIILIALPCAVLIHSLIMHQTLLGNFPMRIRWQAHRYLLGQSYQFYQNEFAGRIATKVMQTALAVRETIMKLLDVLLYVLVYFSGILVLAASLDFRLAIPLLVWFAAYSGLLYYFLPRLAKVSARQADARSDMTGRLVDTYTNISTVKLFSHSNREADYARTGMEHFLGTVYPQMRLATLLGTGVWFINALMIFAVAATSIWLWSNALITTGAIAAAVGLVLRLNGMAQWIMWEVSALFENIGTARDGLNTLSIPREVQDQPHAQPLQISHSQIDFQSVNFNYGKGDGKLLHDFNLLIKPGEKIGLVGRSGAGKSTLVNLLLRFYDIESGRILIDGQNIAAIKQESLRANIGMVTQDTSLLHRSIRDNLLYGKPNATEAEMIHAARQAEAHDFIMGLIDNQGRTGYDAHVGERGVKLSGGQRQRIAIARVLIKNAPILILDEATSALDSEVEAAIQANLTTLMQGKTVIAIAHRLSTIAALDRLIVLDKGQIIEQGTHSELLALGGVYAQLWSHQSGGFLGEF
ncbi:ABC transporter ATP-binding protein [Cellvibrio japonicus]|uniref:ABC-type multidrug efflux pump n=1 Tax=Cellvibrio japonicus (strain Ueda107) TaxID=498211 RepID=B3PE19_CELJU|nr:ABC transporter ATP-binding protein [Cellvibrio japonicus]ACE83660.1 ABC-type multidrug efflux pump [Cellvibrio japonicus Ueda107]QEI12069.1 ABC transporter ATP-binding protein [Cellvibrio japonicus]QEI15643.1 ABC transporter ATP-binding protein [Cellvibrio japonicus]QEI19221.1 ABC transporter ATP-binding protein [Cellvibrio japonicus]